MAMKAGSNCDGHAQCGGLGPGPVASASGPPTMSASLPLHAGSTPTHRAAARLVIAEAEAGILVGVTGSAADPFRALSEWASEVAVVNG